MSYDKSLFELLKEMVAKGERSIEAFEKADVIKDAGCYSETLSESKDQRKEWHQNGLKACADAAVLQKVVSHIYGGDLW